VRETGNRASHIVVFQAQESVDQPATMRRHRQLGKRWRFHLATALGLRYLAVKISDVNVEDFSHAHHHGRAQAVNALFVFLNLLERDTERFAQILLAQFIMMRRARSRSPKYLSIGPALRGVPLTSLARFLLIDRPLP
jgi:hypothetical protein